MVTCKSPTRSGTVVFLALLVLSVFVGCRAKRPRAAAASSPEAIDELLVESGIRLPENCELLLTRAGDARSEGVSHRIFYSTNRLSLPLKPGHIYSTNLDWSGA